MGPEDNTTSPFNSQSFLPTKKTPCAYQPNSQQNQHRGQFTQKKVAKSKLMYSYSAMQGKIPIL